MRLVLVLGIVGRILRLFSIAFTVPFLLALWDKQTGQAVHFASGGLVALMVGSFLVRNLSVSVSFRRAEALAVVSGTWLVIAASAAVPYVLSGLPPVDAFFESMSGFTTTGATILTDWEHSRAFFLWRAMTQWFGGVGVLALFVVVLPHLGVGGRQLFFAEASSAPSESIAPKIRDTAVRLWVLYLFLTVFEMVSLFFWAGMPLYDSLCHALTTMPAGGFSPNPESLMGYANATAFPNYDPVMGEWIITGFMVLSGMSFPLLWIALSRRPGEPIRDGEFRFYIGAILAGSAGVAWLLASGLPTGTDFRTGAFQCASLISSTGYASTDYNLWGDSPRTLLILLMLIGGCAGSAAGGAKAVRNLLSLKFLYRELTRVLHPRAVIPLRYKSNSIPEAIQRAVLTVVALYLIGYIFVGSLLVLLGANFEEAFSASLACLGNIGPGFGEVGPMGSFAGFNAAQKLLLTAAMWFGRLEIVSVLALLHPDVLKKICWRGTSLTED